MDFLVLANWMTSETITINLWKPERIKLSTKSSIMEEMRVNLNVFLYCQQIEVLLGKHEISIE
jgi:hypothetical protein